MKTVLKVYAVIVLGFLIGACAVKDNLQDGYQPGDVADGMIENRQLYCSAPYRGIRAIGRMLVTFLGWVTVPNPCTIIDAVVGANGAPADSGSASGVRTEKVLPGTP